MDNLGYTFSVDDIVNKMKKLRQQYKTEKDKDRKSGNGKRKPWKFFARMDSILGYRPNIQPRSLSDPSSEICANDSNDDEKMGNL